MQNTFQEGAQHPLTTRAPEVAAPTALPLPKYAALAAPASYLIAYLYVKAWFGSSGFMLELLLTLFALLYAAGVEGFCRVNHRAPSREAPLWAACFLLQSAACFFAGNWFGTLAPLRALVWHLCAIWFTLARTGMLAAGQSGILAPIDLLAGSITLPFGGFFLRIRTLFCALRQQLRSADPKKINARTVCTALGSTVVALVLALYAWGLLCAADAQFAALGSKLQAFLDGAFWNNRFFVDHFAYFLLSLPVGAWLYGLAAGGLRRSAPPISSARFFKAIQPLAALPGYSVWLVVGTLCLLYTLFFGVQAAELAGVLARPDLSAHAASSLAVEGFWELCRVQLLNLSILAAARFLAPTLRDKPAARFGLAVFCGFGFCFAALSLGKLWVYMSRFGLTPRRIVSAWFACVLAVWAVLALVWCLNSQPGRLFPAAKLGIFVLAVSFTVLCCVNINALCQQDLITRTGVTAPAAARQVEEMWWH